MHASSKSVAMVVEHNLSLGMECIYDYILCSCHLAI
jgi:hypothetical protein